MLGRSYKINDSPKNRHYSPGLKVNNIKVRKYKTINSQNNILRRNSNLSNKYNTNIYPKTKFKGNLMNEEYSNIDDNNNIGLLKKKIRSQQNIISNLESQLYNYNNKINEIGKLNDELSKIEEEIKQKNEIISDYQNKSEISKNEFQGYINKNELDIKKIEKRLEKLPEIENENNELTKKLTELQDENSKLQQCYQAIQSENKNGIDEVQNEVNIAKKNLEDIIKVNNDLKNENSHNYKEIERLKEKVLNYEKYEIELNDINKKYSLIANKINEKNNNIKCLEKNNCELENKINLCEANYKKIMDEQNCLKKKLRKLEDLCCQYDFAFQKINPCQNTNDKSASNLEEKNAINNIGCNDNNIKSISKLEENKINDNYKCNNLNNNKNLKLDFYNHNNNNKIFGNGNSFNYDYSKNCNNDNKKSHTTINYNDCSYNNYKLNCFPLNNNNYATLNIYRNKSNIDLIRKTNRLLDKSFGYSNYLLDNLKNKISGTYFNHHYQ